MHRRSSASVFLLLRCTANLTVLNEFSMKRPYRKYVNLRDGWDEGTVGAPVLACSCARLLISEVK